MPQRESGEIARIVKAVERAFGHGQKLPPLDLDPDQRIGRSRRGSVSALFGGLLAIAAVAGVVVAGWSGPRRASPPAGPSATAVQSFPGRSPHAAMPTAVAPQPAGPSHPTRIFIHRPARSRQVAHRVLLRPAKPAAAKPSGDALQRALTQDRIRTREMNEAELRRTSS